MKDYWFYRNFEKKTCFRNAKKKFDTAKQMPFTKLIFIETDDYFEKQTCFRKISKNWFYKINKKNKTKIEDFLIETAGRMMMEERHSTQILRSFAQAPLIYNYRFANFLGRVLSVIGLGEVWWDGLG